MKKIVFLFGLLMAASQWSFAQMDKSIKLNVVMTRNATNLQDEYGNRGPWVEIANISHSTYNIRGMYITTDRAVLDETMSVPERVKRMSIIPNGELRTNLSGQQHLVLFLNSSPTKGALHLTVDVDSVKPVWIALYNGNATQLLDSITIPVMKADQSFARISKDENKWEVKPYDAVTPGISNYIQVSESKIDKLKREDPHGFGITVLAMGIVFFCLFTLFVFFSLFGLFMKHRSAAKKVAAIPPINVGVKTVEKTLEIGHKTNIILQDGLKSKGIAKEVYIAVISMALKEYQDNVHDVESGIITIKPKNTDWNDEYIQMTQFHE